MKTFSMNVTNMPNNTIGFGGENGVTEVVLDFGAWAEEYGQGAISLLVKRAMDTHPYPAVLETEGTTATWVITDVETSYKGHGEAQWIYTVGEQIKKSAVFGFNVNRSLNSPVAETPEAYQTWVDDMIALGAGVEQIAEQVYEATGHYPKVENGYWYIWSVVEEDWVNTNQKAQGEQGIPGVGISSTVLNPDYTLTITFTDGSSYTTPPIRGEKGDTGNGIFSTVLNADYTLTITFTNGTTYTTPSIRGVPGQDYVITSADYDEIAGRVDTMIATERQQALDDIDEAKTNAVSDVTLEGTTQKGLVTSEGTTQKGLVTAEGTTQVGLVTAKGQEVIQSIPSDYSELSDDVSELKSDLANKADIIVNSASGAIASFNDGANYPVKQTVFTMNPVQDLHGQEYPYPAGGGKNKCNAQNPIVLSGAGNIGNSPCVIPSGTYTYSATTSTNVAFQLSAWTSGGTQIGSWSSPTSVTGRHSMTFTISDDAAYLRCYYNGATTISDIQVESGSTATAYEPYSNICPIYGYDSMNIYVSPTPEITDETKVHTIEFPLHGINQWDEEWINGYYDTTGNFIVNSSYVASKNKIPVIENTSYCLHSGSKYIGRICFYDKNEVCISTSTGSAVITDRIFTTPNECFYLTFDMTSGYGATYKHDISLNYPSTETGYYPYQGHTVYAGTLTINEDGSGQIVSTMASVDLGTLTWAVSSNGRMTAPLPGCKQTSASNVVPNIKCSQYAPDTPTHVYSKTTDKTVTISNSAYTVWIWDSAYSNADTFKQAMSGVQLVYELAEPIVTDLTEQEVLTLLKGQNNVWHDANGDTAVTYRADTKLYIDNKIATAIASL